MIKLLIGLVAIQHYFIMIMEMLLWEKRGPSVFKSFDKDLFGQTGAMAKNMGLYNGFIATGLFVSLFIVDPVWFKRAALYFLICVIIAGIYAAFTAEKSIFWKQSVLAIITVILLLSNSADQDKSVGYMDIEMGMSQELVHEYLGQPDGSLSGLYGDIYMRDGKRIIIYYDFDGSQEATVNEIKIDAIEE